MFLPKFVLKGNLQAPPAPVRGDVRSPRRTGQSRTCTRHTCFMPRV